MKWYAALVTLTLLGSRAVQGAPSLSCTLDFLESNLPSIELSLNAKFDVLGCNPYEVCFRGYRYIEAKEFFSADSSWADFPEGPYTMFRIYLWPSLGSTGLIKREFRFDEIVNGIEEEFFAGSAYKTVRLTCGSKL